MNIVPSQSTAQANVHYSFAAHGSLVRCTMQIMGITVCVDVGDDVETAQNNCKKKFGDFFKSLTIV